jgi:hypothetical protein
MVIDALTGSGRGNGPPAKPPEIYEPIPDQKRGLSVVLQAGAMPVGNRYPPTGIVGPKRSRGRAVGFFRKLETESNRLRICPDGGDWSS